MEINLGVKEVNTPEWDQPLRGPRDVVKLLKKYRKLPREVFIVVHCTPDVVPKAIQVAAIGSMTGVCLESHDIFRQAILRDTKTLILAHTHPFELRVRPSSEDEELTANIRWGGQVLHIPVLDHVILSEKSHYSFREKGNVFPRSSTYNIDVTVKVPKVRKRRMTIRDAMGGFMTR